MSEAGYTLTETLAAMAVISLAMGGFVFGVQVLSPAELTISRTTAKVEALRATQQRLEGLLALGAPFPSSDASALRGDDHAMQFGCGAAKPCRAELSASAGGDVRLALYDGRSDGPVFSLAAPKTARLAYRGVASGDSHWPPSDPKLQSLRSIALLGGDDAAAPALFEAHVWREQPLDCAFDPVTGGCRP
jgi:prepilin-type N-terminal cleavage/methylation domain-containing protein